MRKDSLASAAIAAALLVSPSATFAAGAADALGDAETQINIMSDAKGPNACGYRSRFVSGDPLTSITVGDVSMMISWSEEHQTPFGMIKVRVERYRQNAGAFEETGVATLTRVQISTADLSKVAVPANTLRESPENPGYYIAAVEGAPLLNVMLPDDVEVIDGDTTMSRRLMFSFKDEANPAQENIRYKVVLKGEDDDGFAGCLARIQERMPDTAGE